MGAVNCFWQGGKPLLAQASQGGQGWNKKGLCSLANTMMYGVGEELQPLHKTQNTSLASTQHWPYPPAIPMGG